MQLIGDLIQIERYFATSSLAYSLEEMFDDIGPRA